MSREPKPVQHVTAHKSWWSGRITALCGETAESGTYNTSTWTLFGLSGPKCPACERIKRGGRL